MLRVDFSRHRRDCGCRRRPLRARASLALLLWDQGNRRTGAAALASRETHDADYGSLREACRTDVDGTSIDALADAARSLGLAAAQVMIPADHVLLGAPAGALPALAVVRLANGMPSLQMVSVGER